MDPLLLAVILIFWNWGIVSLKTTAMLIRSGREPLAMVFALIIHGEDRMKLGILLKWQKYLKGASVCGGYRVEKGKSNGVVGMGKLGRMILLVEILEIAPKMLVVELKVVVGIGVGGAGVKFEKLH
ncbi:hypothetical protein Dsin_001122 [Dipteronia sinensis]|uniref:Uncharacterized protein n=1 Tax=Dipteronia sinensis TaxID=43782 RepID=A0AAE0B395_9ROSI|nr:hypothetical protein Dsin_001122 [Dipteronia sinensis]